MPLPALCSIDQPPPAVAAALRKRSDADDRRSFVVGTRSSYPSAATTNSAQKTPSTASERPRCWNRS